MIFFGRYFHGANSALTSAQLLQSESGDSSRAEQLAGSRFLLDVTVGTAGQCNRDGGDRGGQELLDTFVP